MKTSHEANNFPFLFSFSLFSPNSLLTTLFLNTVETPSVYVLCSMWQNKFYAHTTKSNVIVVCILIFTISENRWVGTTLRTEGQSNLTLVQKGVLYSESKIYNCLPSSIKAHSNDAKRFKTSLKIYPNERAFYSLEEYYQLQWMMHGKSNIKYKISCNMEHDLLILMFLSFCVWVAMYCVQHAICFFRGHFNS
jgi:hypothetical protein